MAIAYEFHLLYPQAAYHILLRLFEDPAAAEFLYPVEPGVRDAKGTPYKRVISDPMDLTTVREKLESRQYDDLEDYLNDLQLIFDNCFKFNAVSEQELECFFFCTKHNIYTHIV